MFTLISVCVCTRNRRAMLERTLGSLEIQLTDNSFDFEIIVIDNGSTDSTPYFLESFANKFSRQLLYFREDDIGIARARNRAIREARGEWVAFIDDDEVAEAEWLMNLVKVARASGADCVGGPVLIVRPEESNITPVGTISKLLGENPGICSKNFVRRPIYRKDILRTPGTGNALIRRGVFDSIGAFNETLNYGEDMEFFRRARNVGFKTEIAPEAIVHHVIEASRLTHTYLLNLARQGGRTQLAFDIEEYGYFKTIVYSVARLAYAIFYTLPLLLVSFLRGNTSWMLSRRCSIVFTYTYLYSLGNETLTQFLDKLHLSAVALKRFFCLLCFYLFARYLPDSTKPCGRVWRFIRYKTCRHIFCSCGTNINVERGAYFGVGRHLKIGDNSGIGINARLGKSVMIGKNVMMGSDVLILTRNHEFSRIDIPMMRQGFQSEQEVLIHDDVWIGARVIILPGVSIGSGAVIGAGAVISENVPPYAVVVGNPAQVVRFRNGSKAMDTGFPEDKRIKK